MRLAPDVKMRVVERRAEPSRFWIRYRPEPWPTAAGSWVDLAVARLGCAAGPLSGIEKAAPPGPVRDDTWYLPPPPQDLAELRRSWAEALIREGAPVIVQLLVGETWPVSGATVVVDMTTVLLDGKLDGLPEAPPGAYAVWPLIPGLTDDPRLSRRGCRRLAEAGFAGVQGVSLELSARDRRQLVEELGEEAFQSLFHGSAPSERAFARAAAAAGLEPFVPRPLPSGDGRLARNRQLAGQLLLLGELWLRLGRPAYDAQELFRAARWLDSVHHDIAALAREGNLPVVPQVNERCRELIGQWQRTGRLTLLEEVVAAYLGEDEDGEGPQ